MAAAGKARELNEHQLRTLQHIAFQMREGVSCEIMISLHEGGVRGYKETKNLKPVDMTPADYSSGFVEEV